MALCSTVHCILGYIGALARAYTGQSGKIILFDMEVKLAIPRVQCRSLLYSTRVHLQISIHMQWKATYLEGSSHP